jgi:guanylate kinase
MKDNLTKILSGYKPDNKALALIKDTKILLLVGPTGAGKDALKIELLKTNNYHHIVSHTTRPLRINHGIPEEDGVDYHFIDLPKAEEMIEKHEFIEAKNNHGNLYGTSINEIKLAHDDHKVALTDVDVQGVREYKELDSNVTAVFLLPPSFVVWQDRLTHRYGDVVDASDHKVRLQTALGELEELQTSGFYSAVINDYMPDTFKQVTAIVANDSKTDDTKAMDVAAQLISDIKDYLAKV